MTENLDYPYPTERILDFDGKDDYIDCGNGSELNFTESMAIEFWFKLTDPKEGSRYYLLGRGDRQYNYSYGLLYQNLKGNHEQIKFLYSKAPAVWQPAMRIGDRQFHHLALVIDRQQVELYIDAQSQGSQSLSDPINPPSDVPFQIGRLFGKTRFKGQIADLRIWNKPRTHQEITTQFQQRLTGKELGLVSYWPLNEGSGNQSYDRTDSGNHGQIEGATWIVPDSSQSTSISPVKIQKKTKPKLKLNSELKNVREITQITLLRSKTDFGGEPEIIYSRKAKKKKKKSEQKETIKWFRTFYNDLTKTLSKL